MLRHVGASQSIGSHRAKLPLEISMELKREGDTGKGALLEVLSIRLGISSATFEERQTLLCTPAEASKSHPSS